MQILIDIPEEVKSEIDCADDETYQSTISWYDTTLYCAIKNGTPLPKGHGRLIDASKIDCRNGAWTFAEAIEYAPTIIKADEGEE